MNLNGSHRHDGLQWTIIVSATHPFADIREGDKFEVIDREYDDSMGRIVFEFRRIDGD